MSSEAEDQPKKKSARKRTTKKAATSSAAPKKKATRKKATRKKAARKSTARKKSTTRKKASSKRSVEDVKGVADSETLQVVEASSGLGLEEQVEELLSKVEDGDLTQAAAKSTASDQISDSSQPADDQAEASDPKDTVVNKPVKKEAQLQSKTSVNQPGVYHTYQASAGKPLEAQVEELLVKAKGWDPVAEAAAATRSQRRRSANQLIEADPDLAMEEQIEQLLLVAQDPALMETIINEREQEELERIERQREWEAELEAQMHSIEAESASNKPTQEALIGDADDDFIAQMLASGGDVENASEVKASKPEQIDDGTAGADVPESIGMDDLAAQLNQLMEDAGMKRIEAAAKADEADIDYATLENDLNTLMGQLVPMAESVGSQLEDQLSSEEEAPPADEAADLLAGFDLSSQLNALLGEVKEIQAQPDPGIGMEELGLKLDKMIVRVKAMRERQEKAAEQSDTQADTTENYDASNLLGDLNDLMSQAKTKTSNEDTEVEVSAEPAIQDLSGEADDDFIAQMLAGGADAISDDTEKSEPEEDPAAPEADDSLAGVDLSGEADDDFIAQMLAGGADAISDDTEKSEPEEDPAAPEADDSLAGVDLSGEADEDFIAQMLAGGADAISDDTEKSEAKEDPAPPAADDSLAGVDLSGEADEDFIAQMLAGGADAISDDTEKSEPEEDPAAPEADDSLAGVDLSGEADDDFIAQMLAGGADAISDDTEKSEPEEDPAAPEADDSLAGVDLSGEADDDFIAQMLAGGADALDVADASAGSKEDSAQEEQADPALAGVDLEGDADDDFLAQMFSGGVSDVSTSEDPAKEETTAASSESETYDNDSLQADLNALLSGGSAKSEEGSAKEAAPEPEAPAAEAETYDNDSLQADLNALLSGGASTTKKEPTQEAAPEPEAPTAEAETYDNDSLQADLNALLSGGASTSKEEPTQEAVPETEAPAEAAETYDNDSLQADLNALLSDATATPKDEAAAAETPVAEEPAHTSEPESAPAIEETAVAAQVPSAGENVSEPPVAEASQPSPEPEAEVEHKEPTLSAVEVEHLMDYNVSAIMEMAESKKAGKTVKRPPPPPPLKVSDKSALTPVPGMESVVTTTTRPEAPEVAENVPVAAGADPVQPGIISEAPPVPKVAGVPEYAPIGKALSGEALETSLEDALQLARDLRDGRKELSDIYTEKPAVSSTVAPVGRIVTLEELEGVLDEAVTKARDVRDGKAPMPSLEDYLIKDEPEASPATPEPAGQMMSLEELEAKSSGKDVAVPQAETPASAIAETQTVSKVDQMLAEGNELSPQELDELLARDAGDLGESEKYPASEGLAPSSSGGTMSLDELLARDAQKEAKEELVAAEQRVTSEETIAPIPVTSDVAKPVAKAVSDEHDAFDPNEKVVPEATAYLAWLKSVSEEGLERTLLAMEVTNSFLEGKSTTTKLAVGLIGASNAALGFGLLLFALL